MKRIVIAILLLSSIAVFSQESRRKYRRINLDNFPQVTLTWNVWDSEVKAKGDFTIKENDSSLNFDFKHIPLQDVKKESKYILILWEDMRSHKGQYDFIKYVLQGFFNDADIAPDLFNIATFNRLNVDRDDKQVLHPLCTGFTGNRDELLKALANYPASKETFKEASTQSNLNQAVKEGLIMLNKEKGSKTGILIVFTGSKNINTDHAVVDVSYLREEAFNSAIPLYIVNSNNDILKSELDGVRAATNGVFVGASLRLNRQQTLKDFKEAYNDIDRQYRGQTYELTYTSTWKPDGKMRPVQVFVDGTESVPRQFLQIPYTFWQWSIDHWWIYAAGILLLLVALFFFVKSRKKQKVKEQQQILAIEDANRRAEIAAQQAQAAQQRVEEERHSRQREKAEQQQREFFRQQQIVSEAEQQRLAHLMAVKNIYPRLQCIVGQQRFVYSIQKPVTTVGREETNDLVLSHPTVSRNHAVITFNGAGFDVTGLSLTNRLILNGQFVEKAALKNTDMMGMGEAVITFIL